MLAEVIRLEAVQAPTMLARLEDDEPRRRGDLEPGVLAERAIAADTSHVRREARSSPGSALGSTRCGADAQAPTTPPGFFTKRALTRQNVKAAPKGQPSYSPNPEPRPVR